MLTSSQRKHLRGFAHSLQPVVFIGKAGLSQAVAEEVDSALETHELIKVKFQSIERGDRDTITKDLTTRVGADLAGAVGGVIILYRPRADPDARTIVLP